MEKIIEKLKLQRNYLATKVGAGQIIGKLPAREIVKAYDIVIEDLVTKERK